MAEIVPAEAPAGFVPLTALALPDANGNCLPVTADRPLPVASARSAAPAPLTGTASAPRLAGPFAPLRDAPVYLVLSGSWTGEVRLMRSTDGGTTRHPLTLGGQEWARFTANLCEALWQEGESGATLWLDCAPTSGTIAYRVSQ